LDYIFRFRGIVLSQFRSKNIIQSAQSSLGRVPKLTVSAKNSLCHVYYIFSALAVNFGTQP